MVSNSAQQQSGRSYLRSGSPSLETSCLGRCSVYSGKPGSRRAPSWAGAINLKMCVIYTFVNCIVMRRIKMGIFEIHITEKGPCMRYLPGTAGTGRVWQQCCCDLGSGDIPDSEPRKRLL